MQLLLPNGEKKILLHTCCAPCSCSIIDALLGEHIAPTLFFYNPNIHPKEEYELRKKEVVRYALKRGISFFDADYEPEKWWQLIQGHEKDPERGERCTICFEMRLKRTIEFATQYGFKVISSSLGFSRWKNFEQVTDAGKRVVQNVKGSIYFEYNWRKKDASIRSSKIVREEEFYRQTYCGCLLSRDNSSHYSVIS